MTVHKIFTPEPTRGCCALFHIQYSSKCFSAPTYKHYLYLLKSAKFPAFGRVLANYVNFVPVNMPKWLNGPCYVEIELRSGILEVKSVQKDPMNFGYKVLIESNSGKRPSWI